MNTIDADTMAVYARHAPAYARMVEERCDPSDDLMSFVSALPPGPEPVLDWGSGCGETAALMASWGIKGEATDASPEMAAFAEDLGVKTRIEPFEALEAVAEYRGIWCNVALSHVQRIDMEPLLRLAHRALVPDGQLQISIHHGDGEHRDSLGRFICCWTPEGLSDVCRDAGFTVRSTALVDGPSMTQDRGTYLIVSALRGPG